MLRAVLSVLICGTLPRKALNSSRIFLQLFSGTSATFRTNAYYCIAATRRMSCLGRSPQFVEGLLKDSPCRKQGPQIGARLSVIRRRFLGPQRLFRASMVSPPGPRNHPKLRAHTELEYERPLLRNYQGSFNFFIHLSVQVSPVHVL